MPLPEFLRELRATLGTQMLLLPGVVAVVFDDRGRVLLGRRSDTGRWALIGGIPDPGEQPACTAVREVYEETAVHVVVERLVGVDTTGPLEYPNGDRAQYVDTIFRCRAVGGQARVNDDESLEVDWFPLDGLPPVSEAVRTRIRRAAADGPAWFAEPDQAEPIGPGGDHRA